MSFRSPSFDNVQETRIGNVVFGRAPVKIISSICAENAEEMLRQAEAIESSEADVIEWRADYFRSSESWQEAVRALKARVTKPLLYTFRSRNEGGARKEPMSDASWRKTILQAIESNLFEAVDIEFERGRADFLVAAARKAHVISIVSWHSFVPGEYDTIKGYFGRILSMGETQADILKIVAMPKKGVDIARFVEEIAVARVEANVRQPLIAMCMGKTGTVTRVGAASFGSCATFASALKSSAPGQLNVATTRKLLDLFTEETE